MSQVPTDGSRSQRLDTKPDPTQRAENDAVVAPTSEVGVEASLPPSGGWESAAADAEVAEDDVAVEVSGVGSTAWADTR